MKTERRSALVTGAAQAAGGAFLWYIHWHAAGAMRATTFVAAGLLWLLAAAFLISALVASSIAARLQGAWMKVARAIGIAATIALFSLLFVAVLPFFLFVRLKDPLGKRRGAASYWEQRGEDDDSLERALRPY